MVYLTRKPLVKPTEEQVKKVLSESATRNLDLKRTQIPPRLQRWIARGLKLIGKVVNHQRRKPNGH